MAREFGTPEGDNPQEKKTDKQIPERERPQGRLPEGDSIREKKVPEQMASPRSPREVISQVVTDSQKILTETSRYSEDRFNYRWRLSIGNLTELYNDPEKSSELLEQSQGSRLGPMREYGEDDEAGFYFQAALTGDVTAEKRTHRLLAREKRDLENKETQDIRFGYSDDLSDVVSICAKKGIDADTWIDTYSTDSNHKLHMKLLYCENQNPEELDRTTASRYQDEVTEQFLYGENLDPKFAWRNTLRVYNLQDTPEKKRAIMGKLKAIDEVLKDSGIGLTEEMVGTYCKFGIQYLADGQADYIDTEWLEEPVEGFLRTFPRNPAANLLQLSLKHYYNHDVPPEELIATIDRSTQESIEIATTNNERVDSSIDNRNSYLWHCATMYARDGNWNFAKKILSELSSEKFTFRQAETFFDSIQTATELDEAKPDEMTLLFNEKLADYFEVKDILLKDDVDEIADLAQSRINEINKERFQTSNCSNDVAIIKKALRVIYQQDREVGHEMTGNFITKLRSLHRLWEIKDFGNLQLEQGDAHGWEALYAFANSMEETPRRFYELTQLALRAAQTQKQEAMGLGGEER